MFIMLSCTGKGRCVASRILPSPEGALDNVVWVLAAAGMTPADIVKPTIFTTDVDAIMEVLATEAPKSLGSSLPASTLVGVSRLAFPELKVEIEVVAARSESCPARGMRKRLDSRALIQ